MNQVKDMVIGALWTVGAIAFVAFTVYAIYDKGGDVRELEVRAEYALIEAQKQEQIQEQEDAVKNENVLLLNKLNELQKVRSDEQRKAAATVANLTERLRNERAKRPVPVPGATEPATVEPSHPGCTGSGLFAEDGIFLIGEAALSLERRDALIEARTLYEQARQALLKLQEQGKAATAGGN